MFDIKSVEADAKKELAEEQGKVAKGKIKDHLKKLSNARLVVANLEREYEVLLQEIGSEG